jgi:hypothetical protein
MGAIEEGGKAVSGMIEAFKSQPLSLALVLMNLALLALLYYVAITAAATRQREVDLIYKSQEKVQDLLTRCVVPERPRT